MTLGDLIKRYRKETGYNMEEFSRKSGLSKAYVSILERNCNPSSSKPPVPSLETIRAVSSAIGMDFGEVIALLDSSQELALTPSAALHGAQGSSPFAARLRRLRQEANLTQAQLCRRLNARYRTRLSPSTISKWETGASAPELSHKKLLAGFFGVSLDYLDATRDTDVYKLGQIHSPPAMQRLPLIGSIACGTPILAEDNIEEMVALPVGIHADFCLRCKGDSMINARIFDGDLVYIHAQPDVENGQIAAVRIDDEATLKRVYKYRDRLELRPENPLYEVLQFEGPELEGVEIIGLAVAFFSAVR